MVLHESERTPLDLADVSAFAAVVETGSFVRAAERIGVSKSIVSRRVARLERRLGARLLTRSAKGAQATDVGAIYFARVGEAIAGLEAAREAVAIAVSEVAGAIRLSAPYSFGVRHLAPVLVEFAKTYPRVELDISLDDRRVDLVGEGFDLAVRIGVLADSSLIARKLAPIRRVVVASPAYLKQHGRPRKPGDLSRHALLLYTNVRPSDDWCFRSAGRKVSVRGNSRLRTNSDKMLLATAEAGLGVAILPTFFVSDSLVRGTLELVLADHPLDESGLFAVMPPGRGATARVRALVEFLACAFGPEPSWDPCRMAAQTSG